MLVVPGIMGSELVEQTSGETLWGLRDPRWYVSAWTSGRSLQALRLTEAERAGQYGRVKPTRLLKFPAFTPLLQGFEPYTTLIRGIRSVVLHEDAVAEFPYDWRLPVVHNAALLADTARRHLDAWRTHHVQRAARRADTDDQDARLLIVAHSMGGMLARQLTAIPGGTDGVRATITLGTPFYGAVKAALMMNSGRGGPVPLPYRRLQKLAVTLPGVYDLLPTYRCVDDGSSARALTINDVVGLGGDTDLARAAAQRQGTASDLTPVGHIQVVGAHQPTWQSLTLRDGHVSGQQYTCKLAAHGLIERIDLGGDGTVYRESAQLPGTFAMPLAQSHGAIAKTNEAVLIVTDALTDRRTGPWLGAGEIGAALPDVVPPGEVFEIRLSGVDHPRDVGCRIVDVETNRRITGPVVVRGEGDCLALATLPAPGLYRVEVTGGGISSLSQLILVADSEDG